MQVTRQHVLDVLRRTGFAEVAEEVSRVLPDPVTGTRRRHHGRTNRWAEPGEATGSPASSAAVRRRSS
jgi:hypothetical protein